MSNTKRTKRIVMAGDYSIAKWEADARRYAKEDAKAEAARTQRIREDALLACYPQIGVLQTAKGRKFYAYINGEFVEAGTDIMKVVDAVEAAVGGELPVC